MGSADEGLLEVRGLIVNYGPVRALRGVTLHVPEGQTVTLIGANGAGKTTTLAALSGLVRPAQGSIRFAGLEIAGWRPPRIVDLGLIQVPEGRAILPQMSVQENLQLGGYRRRDRAALRRDVAAMQERFPILGQRRALPAGSLSGGEQQLLAIARGLLARPRLLLLDEPSMGLAPHLVRQVFEVVQEIKAEGTSQLLVEQNARKALRVADAAYVLEHGAVVLQGPAATLAGDPRVVSAYLGGDLSA
ncbi:MAG TPA: ABC transporter ATP-binding protein [Chloroflexota bacterium]|nr:ABC transporter ATP-binding protein [Chloroflexota bacterium]